MNWQNYYNQWMMPLGGYLPIVGILFAAVIVWSMIWKGIALWKAAQKNDKVWFVVLFLVNTAGILEIFYIYVISKRSQPTNSI